MATIVWAGQIMTIKEDAIQIVNYHFFSNRGILNGKIISQVRIKFIKIRKHGPEIM